MNNILVLAGPSAVGKTTVMRELMELDGGFAFIRSATTRTPRGDGNDSEYLYISRAEFLSRIESGDMLEYTEYGCNLYGTPRAEIDAAFSQGKIPLLILDINGVVALKEQKLPFGVVSFYVFDSLKTLDERLFLRYKDTPLGEEKRSTRALQNRIDYENIHKFVPYFDAFVRNRDKSLTARDILAEFRLICDGLKLTFTEQGIHEVFSYLLSEK